MTLPDKTYNFDSSTRLSYIYYDSTIPIREREDITDQDIEEMKQAFYELVQPLIDANYKEPETNLQWLFNLTYGRQFRKKVE